MVYGLTLYIDQSIYESTSPDINSSYDWIRGTVTYPQNSYLSRCRLSPPLIATVITTATNHYYLPSLPTTAITYYRVVINY